MGVVCSDVSRDGVGAWCSVAAFACVAWFDGVALSDVAVACCV